MDSFIATPLQSGVFYLTLFPQISYNVPMKDKEIKIRVDDEFLKKLDSIQKENGYKTQSETIRRLVNREYMIYILEGIKVK